MIHERLKEKGILAGLALEPHFPELPDCFLMCVTETRTREEIDRLAGEVRG
jgi:glycine dehydrogenase subunit 1